MLPEIEKILGMGRRFCVLKLAEVLGLAGDLPVHLSVHSRRCGDGTERFRIAAVLGVVLLTVDTWKRQTQHEGADWLEDRAMAE